VPIVIGEFELGTDCTDAASVESFGRWLRSAGGEYGWFLWSVGGGFEAQWSPVARRYVSPIPGFPPVRFFRYEDFEVPTNMASWNVQTGGNVPAEMEWVAPGVEGYGHALRVAFGPHADQGQGNWAQVFSCWIFPERFGEVKPDRVTFRLRGDSTPPEVYRQQVFLSEARFEAEKHRALIPLSDTSWHKVTLTGADFTPPVTDFTKIVRITFGCVGENAGLTRKVSFLVDNVDFEQPLQ
jgi:hypothetical protein